MIKTLFTVLFALALSLTVYLYFYLGFYKPVEVAIAPRGPLYLLYKPHSGAYHMIAPDIAEVEKWAKQNNLNCEKTFGDYLDDPDAVDQDRLRSYAGCILPEPLDPKFKTPYKYEVIPEKSYVVARFSGSPSIGPFKVYPRARKFIAEQRLKVDEAVIETYLIHGTAVETEILFSVAPSAGSSF